MVGSAHFPTLMQCLGHAWKGEHGAGPVQSLQYVEAREKIYLPAFQWVLDNVPAVQAALRRVAEEALQVGCPGAFEPGRNSWHVGMEGAVYAQSRNFQLNVRRDRWCCWTITPMVT
jgi:hypothetical protein